MRLVTGLAGLPRGMVFAVHLRESGWLGDIRFMTARTKLTCVWQLRLKRRGIVRMLRQRAMAGFAINARVLAGLLEVGDVRVAILACLVTSEVNRVSGNFFQRLAAIMSVLAEAARNELRSQEEEDDETGDEDRQEPEEMFEIPELGQGKPSDWAAISRLHHSP